MPEMFRNPLGLFVFLNIFLHAMQLVKTGIGRIKLSSYYRL